MSVSPRIRAVAPVRVGKGIPCPIVPESPLPSPAANAIPYLSKKIVDTSFDGTSETVSWDGSVDTEGKTSPIDGEPVSPVGPECEIIESNVSCDDAVPHVSLAALEVRLSEQAKGKIPSPGNDGHIPRDISDLSSTSAEVREFKCAKGGPQKDCEDEGISYNLPREYSKTKTREAVGTAAGPEAAVTVKEVRRSSSIVSFSSIEIRQYERIKGDHDVTLGPALAIGWNFEEMGAMPLDEYENARPEHKKAQEFFLLSYERKKLLRRSNKVSIYLKEKAEGTGFKSMLARVVLDFYKYMKPIIM